MIWLGIYLACAACIAAIYILCHWHQKAMRAAYALFAIGMAAWTVWLYSLEK